jgi:hypothetical protein
VTRGVEPRLDLGLRGAHDEHPELAPPHWFGTHLGILSSFWGDE